MTGRLKSRLARGPQSWGAWTDGGWSFTLLHPGSHTRRCGASNGRDPPAAIISLFFSFFSWVPLRRPLSTLSTTHPPLPQKTPQRPLSFSSSSPPPSLLLDTFEHAGRGRKGQSSKRRRAPPPFLAPDRRRSGPTARGGRRSKPGRRCFQYTEAASSFLQLAAIVSSGFRQLSNNVLLLYLRLLLSYLPG